MPAIQLSGNVPDKKDELLGLLADVEPQAQELEVKAQQLLQSTRFVRDIASPLRDLVAQVPESAFASGQWDNLIDSWRAWQNSAKAVKTSYTAINSFVAVSMAATTGASGVAAVLAFEPPPAPPAQQAMQEASTRLFRTLEQSPLADETDTLMRSLGLASQGGDSLTPLELLAQARGAYNRPAIGEGAPASILIPLRECINAVLAELLKRRPRQERASKCRDKVKSVGEQCAISGLPPGHFDRLGDLAETLMNELSGAKQTAMRRWEISELFHRGLGFLKAFMTSIDPNKLR